MEPDTYCAVNVNFSWRQLIFQLQGVNLRKIPRRVKLRIEYRLSTIMESTTKSELKVLVANYDHTWSDISQ